MDPALKANLTAKIREALRTEGFDLFGIAEARPYPEDNYHIAEWISRGRNGTLHFMTRNSDKRADITALVSGAKSVIVAGLNYFNDDMPEEKDNYVVARYARVRDYHTVIKEKLKRVLKIIQAEVPGASGRVFCDSAPVTEKAWAIRAGLGWRGRNSVIINSERGSFFFLGEIVTNVELAYNTIVAEDGCGTCKKCIEACPTMAICDDRTIDTNRCIAHLTIEYKGDIPYEMKGKTEKMIFGCDRCQEVCPWNNKAIPYTDKELNPDFNIAQLTKSDWEEMTPERFNEIFRHSSLNRGGIENIKRNIANSSTHSPEKR